jgi:hypothetical protein
MEKIPEPIENPDHAWEAAHAEKPLRDIAREDWATADQKETLDALAEARGEDALKKQVSEAPRKPEVKQENRLEEQETIERIIEIIKHSPEIQFVAAGIGNIAGTPGGPTLGRNSCYFDYQSQQMRRGDFDFLDTNPRGMNADKLFTEQWDTFPYGKDTYITVRLPFYNGNTQNPYMTDNRGGAFITLGIKFNKETFSSQDKEIENRFMHPKIEFFDKLLNKCTEEFIPGYYNFVRNIYKEYKKNS